MLDLVKTQTCRGQSSLVLTLPEITEIVPEVFQTSCIMRQENSLQPGIYSGSCSGKSIISPNEPQSNLETNHFNWIYISLGLLTKNAFYVSSGASKGVSNAVEC